MTRAANPKPWGGPAAALLSGGRRLHLQHGPIDLIVEADGSQREAAFSAAAERFKTILEELAEELPYLRSRSQARQPGGSIAKRMASAARPHSERFFITPMAAVAGAVADETLESMRRAARTSRAYVNNGGDIALWLDRGQAWSARMSSLSGEDLGRVFMDSGSGVGGMATSGRGGRSMSMGIADSVTVLAASAAEADAAATMIANSVDLPGSAGIQRVPAREIDPDSDLGDRLVVAERGNLGYDEVRTALAAGREAAHDMIGRGLAMAAALFLQGQAALAQGGEKFFEVRNA